MNLLAALPYQPDSASLFATLADARWPIFLDSGPAQARRGRYDILAADPTIELETRGGTTWIRQGDSVTASSDDPFALVRQHLAIDPTLAPHLPFCGGALGYFAYDLGRRIEQLPQLAEDAEQMPDMAIGIYDWAVVVDHEQRQSWLVGQGRDPRTRARWEVLLQQFSRPVAARARPPFRVTSPVRSNMTKAAYAQAFYRVIDYIRAGDCYQVNLAQRFSATAEGDGWTAYQSLRNLNPAPFAAYFKAGATEILSSSPERLLQLEGRRVETKPIKGTRPRAADPAADQALAQELRQSTKDQAENLMIVDLLRNDLNKTATPGSVKVPVLFGIESYTNVHHMVSTVTGELRDTEDALSLLRGCFPGGSITGAPKLRAMEIIEELEPHRRGVYCGAIGYISYHGHMDTNIAIRTLAYSHQTIRCWAGGGLVLDSKMEDEYQETLVKARAMLKLLHESELDPVSR